MNGLHGVALQNAQKFVLFVAKHFAKVEAIGRVHAYAPPEVDKLLSKYGKNRLVIDEQQSLHRLPN